MTQTLYRIVDLKENITVAQGMTYEQARTTVELYRADYPDNGFSIESYTTHETR